MPKPLVRRGPGFASGVARLVAIKRVEDIRRALAALPVSSKDRRGEAAPVPSRGCRSSDASCRARALASMLDLPQCVRGGCKFLPLSMGRQSSRLHPLRSGKRAHGKATWRSRRRRGEEALGPGGNTSEEQKAPRPRADKGGGAQGPRCERPYARPVREEEAPPGTPPQTWRRAVSGAWRSPHPMRESSYVCGSRLCLRQEKLGAAMEGKERAR